MPMDMASLLSPESVVYRLDVHSKRHALQEVAAVAGHATGVTERGVFDTLLQRERLGSTGVGHGIAIPHGKLAGLPRLSGFFFLLAAPIDFEALDEQPVDIIFALLAPEHAGADHLKALAKIARTLRAPGMVEELRDATSAANLYAVITRATVGA